MVGSSLLAVWTSQVTGDRPGDEFTVALVVGAVTAMGSASMGGDRLERERAALSPEHAPCSVDDTIHRSSWGSTGPGIGHSVAIADQ